MTLQNFLELYTAYDPNNYFDVTANRVEAINAGSGTGYCTRDRGVDHYDGNFGQLMEVYCRSTSEHDSLWCFWGMANVLAAYQDLITTEDRDALIVRFYQNNTDTSRQLGIQASAIGEANIIDRYRASEGFSLDTLYYVNPERDETVGTYGTFYLSIYSDADRLVLVKVLSVELLGSKVDYRYQYAGISKGSAPDNDNDSYMQNLDLQEQEPVPPPTLRNIVTGKPVIDGQREPILSSTEQITGLSAVKGLTVPAGTRLVVIEAETQAVRWRDDGTDPSATVGMPLPTGVPKIYTGDFSAIKFKEQTPSAKLNVSYYK